MLVRSMSLAVVVALISMPGQVRADLLLDTGSATNQVTERDPGSIGFGQGVFAATATDLNQMAMLLEAPGGGHIKYMIWNGTNTNLLSSDTLTVSSSNSPNWILSDPLSFTLDSGSTYYFGVIQDSQTKIIGPFFFPANSVTEHGLTTLDTGNSNYEDFSLPIFTAYAHAAFPLRLYGTQGPPITGAPEPSLLLFLTCGLAAIGWRSWRKSEAA